MPTLKTKAGSRIEAHVGSGNIFADLGVADAEELFEKAKLVHQIRVLIAREKLSQKAAATRLGIDQPKVSLLMAGKLTGFSTERLIKFLVRMNQDVTITVRSAPKKRKGRVLVEAV